MTSKAKTADKSAKSRRTEDKEAAARTAAARDEGREEQTRGVTSDPDARDVKKLQKLGESKNAVGPVETAEQAAKLAAEEAEAAGVSGQAVMRSAPEGYGSGTGEVVQVVTESDEPERNVGSVPSRITQTAAEPKS